MAGCRVVVSEGKGRLVVRAECPGLRRAAEVVSDRSREGTREFHEALELCFEACRAIAGWLEEHGAEPVSPQEGLFRLRDGRGAKAEPPCPNVLCSWQVEVSAP